MKLWKKVAFAAVTIILLAVVGLAILIWSTSRPTKGPRIEPAFSPRSAVLVIDVQEDFTGPDAPNPYPDPERLVTTINVLLARAREAGADVAFVRNVIPNAFHRLLLGGVSEPGSAGIEVDRRIQRLEGEPTFDKSVGDAFSNPDLDAWLRTRHVGRVVIAGLDGRWCVDSTARGAQNRGYRVVMAMDAIAARGARLAALAAEWRLDGLDTAIIPEITF